MAPQDGTVEEAIARIATVAHGVVTWAELRRAEVTPDEIKHRVGIGALIREYRGVYRVGHQAPSLEARYMAAVKACGEDAVLSGRAAAYLQDLIRGKPPAPEVPAPTERRVKALTPRRSKLDPEDRTTYRGIPITTVPRTLVDLGATLPLSALARACHEAGVKYGTTPKQVEAVVSKRPNAKGAGKLGSVIRGDTHVTLSKLERRFLSLLEQHGLPLPETNKPAGGRRVDCRWPDLRLTVELDPPFGGQAATATTAAATHGSRTAGASARPTRAATSSGATRGATSSRSRASCWPSSAR